MSEQQADPVLDVQMPLSAWRVVLGHLSMAAPLDWRIDYARKRQTV